MQQSPRCSRLGGLHWAGLGCAGESAFPAGTGSTAAWTFSSGVTERWRKVKLQSLDKEIKERCLFQKDSIMHSIRKHQSVVEIIFGESEETVRHLHVICITMKSKVALIKNRMRKTYTVEGAMRPGGSKVWKMPFFHSIADMVIH